MLAKYKSSLEVAKEAYRTNNSDYEIMYILAKISLALGDRNAAITHYTSAINKFRFKPAIGCFETRDSGISNKMLRVESENGYVLVYAVNRKKYSADG